MRLGERRREVVRLGEREEGGSEIRGEGGGRLREREEGY